MRRAASSILVVLLAAVLMAGGTALVHQARYQDRLPVYSVSQVEAGLFRHPDRWLGRTIRVKAVLLPMPQMCAGPMPQICEVSILLDYPTPTPLLATPAARAGTRAGASVPIGFNGVVLDAHPLILHPERDRLLAAIRKVPGLGRLLPRPQPVLGFGTYRVSIRPAPTSQYCPQQPCYWAVVPDAGSDPNSGRPFGLGR